MDLKSLLKSLKLNETVISMGLGALIVIISAILVFNYFVQKRGSITPTIQIGDEPIVLPTTHTVAKSETLWMISEKYYKTGYNWTDIAQENDIIDANQIEVGQNLTIPNVTPKLSPTLPQEPQATSSASLTATPVPQITSEAASTEAKTQPEGTYRVVKGDSLWKIAEKQYGSGYNWIDIASVNGLKAPYILEEGQELTIPDISSKTETVTQVSPSPETDAITDASYTVVKGDSLWKIALRAYGDGYKWADIAKANNLLHPDIIHTGNVLTLPR